MDRQSQIVLQLETAIQEWIEDRNHHNARRPHSSLDRRTPDEAYFAALQPIPVAA